MHFDDKSPNTGVFSWCMNIHLNIPPDDLDDDDDDDPEEQEETSQEEFPNS
jgi:hypothetical protein